MIEFVQKLLENGYAYETSTAIYFDVSKLDKYGLLSGIDVRNQMAGARVKVDEEKRNPYDFALFIKAPENHIMKWDSQWGVCYPGWHIECSAMGNKYLGEKFDIHTGGVDHIPIHHENEIAQAKGATGTNPANYWMHNEFLLMDGGKMSKSLGNCYTVTTIEERGYEPLSYRYLNFTSHYRNKLNYTWEGIDAAQVSLNRLRENYKEHLNGNEIIESSEILRLEQAFLDAINDDMNMPAALAVVWEIAKSSKRSKDYAKLLDKFDTVLSLNMNEEPFAKEKNIEIDDNIRLLLDKRKEARANKDFKTSDEIRDELMTLGYKVIDTKEGQKIEKI
jgi:cysteinyl-tRNA synthetase